MEIAILFVKCEAVSLTLDISLPSRMLFPMLILWLPGKGTLHLNGHWSFIERGSRMTIIEEKEEKIEAICDKNFMKKTVTFHVIRIQYRRSYYTGN